MKKALIIFVLLTLLLASFALVGGVSADENSPHLCIYTGLIVPPGISVLLEVHDANGALVYSETVDALNASDWVFSNYDVSYLPVVSGTVTLTITISGFGSYQFVIPANELGNGECFDDFRLNSRPDRDLAAPVAIYIRFAEDGDGFDGFDVYDIDQFIGTGTLSLRVTEAELNAAYDQALDTGENVTIAHDGDILFTMLGSSTESEGICQVNAIDQEGKIYEYRWVCLS